MGDSAETLNAQTEASSPPVSPRRRWFASFEVLLAAGAVTVDVFVPTLVILLIAGVSLVVRRAGPGSVGFRRPARALRMLAEVAGLVVAWTVLQIALFIPVLEHLTGKRQDVGDFATVEGDVGMLLGLLALSWTLAAIGEETAYRGFLISRCVDACGASRAAIPVAVVVSAVLFGLAHTEQGLVGVGATFLDALFFAALRFRYRTLWAPIFAHGLNNTIGLVTFFLVGPVYGLW